MTQIIQGPWKKDHHTEHQEMFNSLITLLSDLDNSMNSTINPGAVVPRDENGVIQWDQISVAFLIQWSMLNASKIGHKHGE
jgi:glutaminase